MVVGDNKALQWPLCYANRKKGARMDRPILFLTNLVFGFIEFMLGLRIILKLFSANAATPFVQWVYETSRPLLAPFEGIFPTARLEGGFIIEFSAIFALLIYALIAYFIHELIASSVARRRS